jgi:hypothetical protein
MKIVVKQQHLIFNLPFFRLFLDQVGGIELDPRGARRRKWCWKDQVQHVHAPPIQPITFAVTPNLAVRVMDQANITLSFNCKTRSCRFQVGSRLKVGGEGVIHNYHHFHKCTNVNVESYDKMFQICYV